MAKKQKANTPAEPQPKPERCKWDPAYCAKLETLGAEGKSAPEIRKELGIPPSTWRNWTMVGLHAARGKSMRGPSLTGRY